MDKQNSIGVIIPRTCEVCLEDLIKDPKNPGILICPAENPTHYAEAE